MFQDLDTALTNLLHDPAAPADVRNADISFETPDKNFTPADGTVNLFLFDLKENRELRDPEPIREIIAGVVVRRQPPLRTDCTYLVTAWANNLANPPFPPPTMVAQAKADNSAGEFWSALGIPPRPAFYLTVTIALELGMQTIEGPPVVTKEIILSEIPTPIVATWFEIGGTVRDSSTTLPVEAAEVTLVETGAISVTDEQGHFRFSNLEAGNYTLHVVAAGFAPQDKPVAVPGLVLNEYDVAL